MIETRIKTTTSAIVNRNNASSMPLLVLKEDSAAPNKAVPCPFTCMSITAISRRDIKIIVMFIAVSTQ
jgi:hypothetical protein